MKNYTKSLTVASVTLATLSFPIASVAAATFSMVCGTNTLRVPGLKDIGKMTFNTPCVIDQSPETEIGIFCKGKDGLVLSKVMPSTAQKPPQSIAAIYDQNKVTIGRHQGQTAKDRFVIFRNGMGALIMKAEKSYNAPRFTSSDSMILDKNATQTVCDVLPFKWDQTIGC